MGLHHVRGGMVQCRSALHPTLDRDDLGLTHTRCRHCEAHLRRGNPGVPKRVVGLLDCHAPKRGLAMTAFEVIQP